MSSAFDPRQPSEAGCDEVHWHAICSRLKADPKDPDALFAYAAYLASWHRTREAMITVQVLFKICPDYPGLWRFKARLFREMGDAERAAQCLKFDNDPYY